MEKYIIQNVKTGEVLGGSVYDTKKEAQTAIGKRKGYEIRVIPDPQQMGLYVQQRIHDDHRPGYYMGIDTIVEYVTEYLTDQKKERKSEQGDE